MAAAAIVPNERLELNQSACHPGRPGTVVSVDAPVGTTRVPVCCGHPGILASSAARRGPSQVVPERRSFLGSFAEIEWVLGGLQLALPTVSWISNCRKQRFWAMAWCPSHHHSQPRHASTCRRARRCWESRRMGGFRFQAGVRSRSRRAWCVPAFLGDVEVTSGPDAPPSGGVKEWHKQGIGRKRK